MPLKLITGPANANKAGHLLGDFRQAVREGREPVLVVPTMWDVDAFRRELAADLTIGFSVERFSGLARTMAQRSGVCARVAGELFEQRAASVVARRLADKGTLSALEGSARTPGFGPALAELAAELATVGCGPAEFAAAAASWGRSSAGREGLAADLASLYGGFCRELEDAGLVSASYLEHAVTGALRADGSLWGDSPVFLYGFDDLTASQLDVVEALAAIPAVEVTVSLPWEPGRAAFEGRRETFERLSALADTVEELPPVEPEGDDPGAQALFEIERRLFEPSGTQVDPAGGVELLAGGDERAELELVAERILRLHHRDGIPLDEIVVAVRDARASGPLIDEVFAEAGVPVDRERWVRAGETSTGRSLGALLRCASGEGRPSDLVTWLRAPGIVRNGWQVDRLEASVMREGITELDGARALWEEEINPAYPLDVLDDVAAAAASGPAALCREMAAKARRLVRAPWNSSEEEGTAPVFGPERELDSRAAGATIDLLERLATLSEERPALAPGPDELARLIAAVEVSAGDAGRPGAVRVASPLAIRAQRVSALFLCRLNEGIFPRAERSGSLLGDASRRQLEACGGLSLPGHETSVEQERYLLYAAVSRPTDLLVLSWHESAGEGSPRFPSPFVADITGLLEPPPQPRSRGAGAIGWGEGDLVSERQSALALAPGGDGEAGSATEMPALLDAVADRTSFSVTELETYARCPFNWFVRHRLKPDGLDPDGRPLVRGRVLHEALREVYGELDGPMSPEALEGAIETARRAIAEHEAGNPLAADLDRRRIARARLAADVIRYLEAEAQAGRSFVPVEQEFAFGADDDGEPAVELAEGVSIRGRIDRVDAEPSGDEAVVIDYKGRGRQPPHGKWLETRTLQAALYAIAWQELRGARVTASVYQQTGDSPDSPGYRLDGAGDPVLTTERRDGIDAAGLAALLDEARELAVSAAEGIRAGRIDPTPETCTPRGGCAFPSICRCRA